MENCDLAERFGDTSPGLHEKILEMMASEKLGRVLDAPAGEGRLSYLLKQKGFDVLAGDIDENVFKAPDVGFRLIDLNAQLPFETGEFDHVICVEGIEHIENSFHLARELSRVLKIGGKLILSTPNILSIHSRLRYLLTGHFAFFGGYYSNEDNFYTYHINPAGFVQIRTALEQCNLFVEQVATNRSSGSGQMWPVRLALRALAAAAKFVMRRKESDVCLRKMLCSKEILMGENIILKCVKREG